MSATYFSELEDSIARHEDKASLTEDDIADIGRISVKLKNLDPVSDQDIARRNELRQRVQELLGM